MAAVKSYLSQLTKYDKTEFNTENTESYDI